MSDRRAALRRLERAQRKGRPIAPFDRAQGNRLIPAKGYGVTAGWASDEAALEEARRQTHDTLLRQMGGRRRGDVTWRLWTGEEARRALGQIKETAAPENRDYYRRIGQALRDGGWLVVAMAPGDPP